MAVPAPGPPRRASAAGYWVAGAVVLIGLVAATAWFAAALVGLMSAPDGFERFAVPSSNRVHVGAGDWELFHEYRGAGDTPLLATPEVRVTGPGGERVPVARVLDGYSYDWGDHEGVAYAGFHAATAGTYTVEVLGEPGGRAVPQEVALGKSPNRSDLVGLLLPGVLAAAALLAGAIVAVVTLVRRRSATGAPGPPGPAGWGPPAVR